jgi:hypothetical protein
MPLDAKLQKMIQTLVRVAQRWHGLSDVKAITDFIANDIVDTPEMQRAAVEHIIEDILSSTDLSKQRELYGDTVVDNILRVAKECEDEGE